MAQKGLGTGLGALFGDDALNETREREYLPISKIEPRQGQPRVVFDEEALEELAASIREHGVIQPLTVRAIGDGYYQIIAGERRWRAARLAGLAEVPARIMDADDRLASELALVENLQREDLNPVEEARGYRSLMDEYGLTQEKVSERVGKSRPVIANSMRLLQLPDEVLALLSDGKLTLSHARAILEANTEAQRLRAARETVEKNLTVRETTALVKRLILGAPKKTAKPSRVSKDGVDYMAEVEKNLTKSLGRRVKVVEGGRKGRIEIEFYGKDDFENVRKALQSLKLSTGEVKKG